MYTVRILKAATRELERLDKAVGRRVAQRITWLAENADKGPAMVWVAVRSPVQSNVGLS